ITDKLVSLFNEFPNKYNIVISRGLSDSAYAPPPVSGKHLKVYNWVDDRYKYLKACDLLVTRGGHNTVGEAIYYKKPMVIIPTIGHSEHQGIAESITKMNLGKTIQQNNLDYLSLYSNINELLTSSYYSHNIQRAAQFAEKYNAVASIYETVCDILNVPFKTF
ncbi:MAG TPA: glycosyltransferase, partial [Candidatus Methanomethylicus sp.]|nr:glycosyltransferase [Candidatus Methanomethylicus sp.]